MAYRVDVRGRAGVGRESPSVQGECACQDRARQGREG